MRGSKLEYREKTPDSLPVQFQYSGNLLILSRIVFLLSIVYYSSMPVLLFSADFRKLGGFLFVCFLSFLLNKLQFRGIFDTYLAKRVFPQFLLLQFRVGFCFCIYWVKNKKRSARIASPIFLFSIRTQLA